MAKMPDTASSVFVFATALTNLAVAAYAGREALRKAKEAAGALQGIEDQTKIRVSEITAEVGSLTKEVAGLSKSITSEFHMFNARFKAAQDHLTLVLTALVSEDPTSSTRRRGDRT